MPHVDVMHVCYGGMGGIRSIVNVLADELSRVGLTSGVIPIGMPGELVDDPDAWPGLRIVHPVVLRHRADVNSMVHAFSAARRIRARAVFMHSPRHALPVYLGRRVSGQRGNLVTVEHTAMHTRSRALNINSASCLACSRAVVFLTPESAAGYPLRRLPFHALSRAAVVPNGVLLDDVPSVAGRPKDADGEWRIGMAARFVPQKDFDTLIESMVLVERMSSDSPVRLILAGDGPELPRVRALAARLGVDRMIDFVGSLPEHQIPDFLNRLDVYVHSTHGETSSMSLLEAAAARVPIVASDVEGVHDIFTQGVHARLTEPQNAGSLANGIVDVIGDRQLGLQIASNAYDLVASRYSSRQMAAAYLGILERIDARGPWRAAHDALIGHRSGAP